MTSSGFCSASIKFLNIPDPINNYVWSCIIVFKNERLIDYLTNWCHRCGNQSLRSHLTHFWLFPPNNPAKKHLLLPEKTLENYRKRDWIQGIRKGAWEGERLGKNQQIHQSTPNIVFLATISFFCSQFAHIRSNDLQYGRRQHFYLHYGKRLGILQLRRTEKVNGKG